MGYYFKPNKIRTKLDRVDMYSRPDISNRVYTENKKIIDVFKPNAWVGKRCFITAGGPSLAGFNYRRLANEKTIAINRSFELYNASIVYCMDVSFHINIMSGIMDNYTNTYYKKAWLAYNGTKVFLSPQSKYNFENDNVYLIRNSNTPIVSKDISVGIHGGNNSGYGAIMLAIAMGCSIIYLLGYDFKVSNENTHCHSGYPKQQIDQLSTKLNKYLCCFETNKAIFEESRVKIYNCNPDSRLKLFPFKSIDEVLS